MQQLGAIRSESRALSRSEETWRYTDFVLAGEGGMGAVYMAYDTERHRTVALKVLRPRDARGPTCDTPQSPLEAVLPARSESSGASLRELRARFNQEAYVTRKLEHTGVVPVYDIGETPAGLPFFTMRFVPGQRTLADAIQATRAEPLERRLPLLEPLARVCDVVSYAHTRNVLHRDLKPHNIMLGEGNETVLLDWGLAKIRDGRGVDAAIRTATIRPLPGVREFETPLTVGTPGYIAPEAATGGGRDLGPACDVYSLGVMLFEILTGRLPHPIVAGDLPAYLERLRFSDTPAPSEIQPDVPPALDALCVRALARDPAARERSACALAAGMRAWRSRNRLRAAPSGRSD